MSEAGTSSESRPLESAASEGTSPELGWVAKEPAVESYVPASASLQATARESLNDPEALYQSLVRALKWRKGFGILFIQCTPAKAQEIFPRLEKDLTKKKIGRLTLTEPVGNLFKIIAAREDVSDINALFIEGIDQSLAPYIKSEVGRNDYYKLEVLPPVLNHLNRLRDNFLQAFPHLCLVFVVPPFALKYFMYRAIDFFSWNSGIWRFHPDNHQLDQATQSALSEAFSQYQALSAEEIQEKIVELQDLIDVEVQTDERKAGLLEQQGLLLAASEEWSLVLRCFEQSAELSPPSAWNWFVRGLTLSNFGDYEEAIASYDLALKIKPDKHEALNNKGNALGALGRYEEAIASYDLALKIKPNDASPWYNKACAYALSSKPEKAVIYLQKAIELEGADKYIEMATIDTDFDPIRSHPQFQALTAQK